MTRTRVLFLDVDGTLTDGGILLGATEDLRGFHAHDGVGIRLATIAGMAVVFLSARENAAAARRARELNVRAVLGASRKDEHVHRIAAEYGATALESAFVGDDLQDIVAMRIVGRAVAVADAVPEVKAAAHHVTKRPGGRGAVRDAVEWILREEGRYEETVAAFIERSDFVIRLDGAGEGS